MIEAAIMDQIVREAAMGIGDILNAAAARTAGGTVQIALVYLTPNYYPVEDGPLDLAALASQAMHRRDLILARIEPQARLGSCPAVLGRSSMGKDGLSACPTPAVPTSKTAPASSIWAI